MARPFSFHALGPWPLGMARPERATDFPPQALADAVNADVRPTGSVATVAWWSQVSSVPAHSLFRSGDVLYGVVGGVLGKISSSGFASIGWVTSASSLSWSDVAGVPHFSDGQWVYRVLDDNVQRLTAQTDWQDRNDVLADMPGGHWLAYWNGRLLVARGQSLLFSQPLRYGATNPLTDYVELGGRAQWLAPLESGIYVGLRDRVLWFEGASPFELRVRQVAKESAPGAALVISGEALGEPLPGRVAVFFTPNGFAVGDGQGVVTYPQAKRFFDLPLFEGKIIERGTRIFFIRRL